MNCRHVQRLLSDQIDRSLPQREAGAVAAHLEQCPACRQRREEFLAIGAVLRTPVEPFPLPDLERRAIVRWRRQRESAPRYWSGFLLQAPAVAVALAALALTAGLILFRWNGSRLHRRGPSPVVHRLPAPHRGPGPWPSLSLPPHPDGVPMVKRDLVPRTRRHHGHASTAVADWSAKGTERSSPVALRPSRPLADDMVYLNGASEKEDAGWSPVSPDEWERIEARVRQNIRVRDNFVQIPFPRLASASPSLRQIAAAVDQYKKEAAIVDPRLSREVTLQLKAVSLSELCDRLRADTGIEITAGASVADEKVTVLVREQPLRAVMRQLSRPFGYTWLRSGPPGQYRYDLVQDLRSQLEEEELRNRDLHAALLALDEQMAAYRPYLNLSPAELKARLEPAKGPERELLQKMTGPAWGVVETYYRLTPAQRLAVASGEALHFSVHAHDPSRELPVEWRQRLLQSSFLTARNFAGLPALAGRPNDTPLAEVPEAMPTVDLRIDRSELGQLSLMIGYGVYFGGDPDAYGGYELEEPLAVGRSPSVAGPRNADANHELRDQPFFRRLVSFHPKPSCPRFARSAVSTAEEGEPLFNSLGQQGPEPPHVSTADVWEAVHQATGLNIVTDSYSHFYPLSSVTVGRTPLFEALCQVGDTLGVRWKKEGNFLIGRSTSFFWDKLKEVPNHLLIRWQRDRREHGGLPFEDLLEMAALSDQQLDSTIVGRVIEHCWELPEWGIVGKGAFRVGVVASELRPYLRFLARLTPSQLQHAQDPGSLSFEDLTQGQQEEFARIALWRHSPSTLPHLRFHFDYVPAGVYLWQPEVRRDQGEEAIKWPLVAGPSGESVLAAARRLYPAAEPAEIRRSNGVFSIAFEAADGQVWQIGRNIFFKIEE